MIAAAIFFRIVIRPAKLLRSHVVFDETKGRFESTIAMGQMLVAMF
jgi:hypothetical protein